MNLQKIGGCAARCLALLYVAGIVLNFTYLNTTGIVDPLARAIFEVEHRAAMSAFILAMYAGFAILLVLVALAIQTHLSAHKSDLVRVATVFALIWATLLMGSGIVFHVGLGAVADLLPHNPTGAASLLQVVEMVHQGLGCTAEIPGGLWILLLSIFGLRTNTFPKTLAWTGIVSGSGGILSTVPALFEPAVAVYAFLSIVWFAWMGSFLHKPLHSHS